MDKNQIISKVYKDDRYRNFCRRVTRNNQFCDDLFQYCFEQLLNKPDEFIIEKYNDNKLDNYFFGIAYKSYNSKHSQFYKEYLSEPFVEIEIDVGSASIQSSIVEEKLREFSFKKLNNWVSVLIFREFIKLESIREVSRVMNMPFETVRRKVYEVKSFLKKEIKCEY